MMTRFLVPGLVGFGLLLSAPAMAAKPGQGNPSLSSGCVSVALADGGCLFSGNDQNTALVQQIYNAAGKPGGPIELNLIAKFELPGSLWGDLTLDGFGTVTGLNSPKGGWSLADAWLVDYVSVKAGNQFLLYRLDTPAMSGVWSTLGALGGKDLSHISFYGRPQVAPPPGNLGGGTGVIPEASTWAMLITGFGLVGLAMRRRRGSAPRQVSA
ncbi:PEPxxWA-CTERM sorting domain-containing protein [Thermaurantiacus sp.]